MLRLSFISGGYFRLGEFLLIKTDKLALRNPGCLSEASFRISDNESDFQEIHVSGGIFCLLFSPSEKK